MGFAEILRGMMASVKGKDGWTASFVGAEAGRDYVDKWTKTHSIEPKAYELVKMEEGNPNGMKPGWYCEIDVTAEQFEKNRDLAHAYTSQIMLALFQEGVLGKGQSIYVIPSGYKTQDGRAVINIQVI